MAKRAVIPAAGDKDEGYDDQAGTGSRFRIRRYGWRKAPFGHGHTCPECRANVSEWHRTAEHDMWHRQLDDGFATLDTARDDDRALLEQLHDEVAELRAVVEGMREQARNFATILGLRWAGSEPVSAGSGGQVGPDRGGDSVDVHRGPGGAGAQAVRAGRPLQGG